MAGLKSDSILIGGVWLRKEGRDKIVVLVEVDGQWREVIRERWPDGGEFEISHAVHPSGIRRAPLDPVTKEKGGS